MERAPRAALHASLGLNWHGALVRGWGRRRVRCSPTHCHLPPLTPHPSCPSLHPAPPSDPPPSLLPLAVRGPALAPGAAAAALTLALAFSGFNYSGFHSYVQEVAPRDAGLVLGITNTAGTLTGLVGNLATGHLAAGSLGFAAVFAATSAIHLTGAAVWLLFARGRRLHLTPARG